MSPAVSWKQQRFMMSDLARLRKGEKTKTGMSESQLLDYEKVVEKKPSVKRLTSPLTRNVKRIKRYHRKVFRRV